MNSIGFLWIDREMYKLQRYMQIDIVRFIIIIYLSIICHCDSNPNEHQVDVNSNRPMDNDANTKKRLPRACILSDCH